MGNPWYVICCFSLVAFVFNFCQLDFYVAWCGPPWVYPAWDSLCFLDWVSVSFPMLGKFSAITSSNIFSGPFPSLFFFWDPYNVNVDAFNVVPEVSDCLHFILFFKFYSTAVISTNLSSSSLIHSSASFILPIPSSTFFCFSYYIVHLCLFIL